MDKLRNRNQAKLTRGNKGSAHVTRKIPLHRAFDPKERPANRSDSNRLRDKKKRIKREASRMGQRGGKGKGGKE